RPHDLAVRADNLGREQALAVDAVHPLEPATATAERQAADTRIGHPPSGDREAVLLRGAVEVRPGRSTSDPSCAGVGVDGDLVHRSDVDHDAGVAGALAGCGVAAAAYRVD